MGDDASGVAAILLDPILIGTVDGMNLEVVPEPRWALGYPFALLLMAAVSLSSYLVFKRRDRI